MSTRMTVEPLTVLAGNDRVEISGDTRARLVDDLKRGGTPVRDRETHEVMYRTPMADLGHRLRGAFPNGYRPDADDRAILIDLLHVWMANEGDGVPQDALRLRHMLVDARAD
jgi:hypothetical protein